MNNPAVLYLISIFLLNQPYFYILYKSLLFSRIAEIIWLILLFIFLFSNKKKIDANNKVKIFLLLSLVFFISQSSSVIYSLNIKSFIFRYEILIFSFIFLFLTIFINKNKLQTNLTITILTISFILPSLIELIIYFLPNISRQIFFPFIQKDTVNLIEFNLSRGRINLENYNYTIIPLLFYLLFRHGKILMKILILLMISAIIIIAFSSNYRSVFLLTTINIGYSLFIFRQKITNKFLLIFILILSFYLGSAISNKLFNYNVIDRIFIQDFNEDYKPIIGRINMWSHASDVGLSSPIVGVGLGNYSQYSTINIHRLLFSTTDQYTKYAISSTAQYPHNIFFETFAESGIFGLIALLILLLYFVFSDIKSFLLKNNYLKCLIIGFWSLFAYSLFNPAIGFRYVMLFWLFRALIIKVEEYKIN